jgi:hypothetical protein
VANYLEDARDYINAANEPDAHPYWEARWINLAAANALVDIAESLRALRPQQPCKPGDIKVCDVTAIVEAQERDDE